MSFDDDKDDGYEDYNSSPFASLSLYADEEDLIDLADAADPPKAELPSLTVSDPLETIVSALEGPPPIPSPVPAPVSPQKPAEPLQPAVLEETLIVAGVSLNSGETSQYMQQETMLNYLIKNALTDQASAIHLEPQEMLIRVRFRINGVMHQKTALPKNLGMPMAMRLKQLCSLEADKVDIPQRNRVQAKFNQNELELGLATYPGSWGETMVLTLRQKQSLQSGSILNLAQIGLSPLSFWRWQKSLSQPGGMLIVTGPARTGKTTSLYASIHALNILTRSISTAESPIEALIPGINQASWTPESGISFQDLIRSMSYLDPDVLLVSEWDSPETVEASVELALGGAKLVTTYPSFDTMGALLRLTTQGLEQFLIASSNVSILSQRLVRKLCEHCKQPERPRREYLKLLGLLEVEPESFELQIAKGCVECNHIGYSGQTAIHELLVINETIREAILNHQPAARIRELARTEAKLISMVEDGYFKCTQGITSLAEIQRVAFVNEFDSHDPRTAEEIVAICQAKEKSFH